MAKQFGVSDQKLGELGRFERSSRYSAAEKAALRVAERTRQSGRGLDDELYGELKRHFSIVQILEITAVATAFQFFNRFVDALRIPVTPLD